MGDHVLGDRERALEDAFFARQERELLEKLRDADRTRSHAEAIAAASGIRDEAVLRQITALGLGAETVAALALVPLALVAWADGSLDSKERAAVMDAAREGGVASGSEAARLLDTWLATPPGAELKAAWRGYAAALSANLDDAARATLRRETVGRARRVAEAAGGVLGLGRKVSEAEERVLNELDAAFAG
jgi:hypothetical protein